MKSALARLLPTALYAALFSMSSFAGTVAVYWDPSGTPHVLGGSDSAAYAINDAGWIVGQSNGIATLWANGQTISLGTLPGFATSKADGINNDGQIVGFDTNGNQAEAFLYDSNGLHDLGPGDPVAINNAGLVILDVSGQYDLWNDGTLTPLPADFIPTAINSAGQIVGGVGFPNPELAVFDGSTLTPIPLPLFYGYEGTYVPINDSGIVAVELFNTGVGYGYNTFLLPVSGGSATQIPFPFNGVLGLNNNDEVLGGNGSVTWQNGTSTTLAWQWGYESGIALNDSGEVVGYAETPEPATLALAGLGACLVFAARRQRQLNTSADRDR
jgi:probable HAF family extracellular repeat protein